MARSNEEITKALTERFPPEAIKRREATRGGKLLDYVDGTTVMRRLISATDNQWNMHVLDQQIQPWTATSKGTKQLLITARVRLEIPGMGSREHMGVQIVQEGGGEDMWKGAITDALKKAATLFGVGLELYGPDYEAGEVDERPEPRPQPRQQQAPPPQRPPDRQYQRNAPPAQRPAPSNGGFRPTDKQKNFARSLWKDLGYIVIGEDGGTHHDATQLDSYCRQFFGAGFEDLDGKTMSALIDDLKSQTRAGAPER